MQNYGTVTATSSSSSPATVGFIRKAKEAGKDLYAQRRPWGELLQLSACGKPDSFADALVRVRKNLYFFRVNYALIVFGIVFVALLWHPVSLIVLLVMFVLWGYFYFFREEPVVVFGKTLTENVVIGALSVLTIVALLLTHATKPFLEGLLIAVLLVIIHAILRQPEDFYSNDDEAVAGFVSVPERG